MIVIVDLKAGRSCRCVIVNVLFDMWLVLVLSIDGLRLWSCSPLGGIQQGSSQKLQKILVSFNFIKSFCRYFQRNLSILFVFLSIRLSVLTEKLFNKKKCENMMKFLTLGTISGCT